MVSTNRVFLDDVSGETGAICPRRGLIGGAPANDVNSGAAYLQSVGHGGHFSGGVAGPYRLRYAVGDLSVAKLYWRFAEGSD